MKVYFEERGHGMGEIYLQAYVTPTQDGHAYSYDSNGKKYEWAWAHPSEARVFEHTQLPKDLWFSIKNGSCDMTIPASKKHDWNFSDLKYRKISREQVEASRYVHKHINEVQTIDDFKKLYPIIRNCAFYIPECVYKLCELFGVGKVPMVNGELGLAFYQQVCIYNQILKKLELV